MQRSTAWVAPATGIVFIALVIVAIILVGEGQDATEKSAEEIAAFYQDNEDEQSIGAFVVGLASVFFLFFAGHLRRLLRDAEGPGGMLSAVSFAGAIVFVTGAAVVATINLALADLADDIDPVALQAINGITWDYYIPFVVGMTPFLFAAGLCAVRTGALPKWLGWIAIVLGVASYTPVGFFAFLLGLVWILVVSVMLTVRARSTPGAPGAPGGVGTPGTPAA
jgi:hypothetical protein